MTKRYRLLNDLPASKAGEIFTNKERGYYYPEKYVVGRDSIDTGEAFLPKYVENNPTWFAPIEEPKEEQPFQFKDDMIYKIATIINAENALPENNIFDKSEKIYALFESQFKQQTNTIPSQPKRERPPLGVIPQWRHKEIRYGDLDSAISRYVEAGKQIPQEWIDERHDIGMWLINRKNN